MPEARDVWEQEAEVLGVTSVSKGTGVMQARGGTSSRRDWASGTGSRHDRASGTGSSLPEHVVLVLGMDEHLALVLACLRIWHWF